MKLGAAVARRLRRFRHQSGLTQEELAARAGLNRNYIGMIEREENSPTVDTLEKLAAVLKIEPQLFFVDDELISDAVGLQGSSHSTRKGHPLGREGGGSRRRP
jgi:transcriptional regulator with XRE-family HTH domain